MNANLAALLYLIAGVLFILSLRGLSSPATSRQGNFLGMIGMAIAIATTIAIQPNWRPVINAKNTQASRAVPAPIRYITGQSQDTVLVRTAGEGMRISLWMPTGYWVCRSARAGAGPLG